MQQNELFLCKLNKTLCTFFRKCEFLQIAKDISDNEVYVHQKRAEEIKNLKNADF